MKEDWTKLPAITEVPIWFEAKNVTIANIPNVHFQHLCAFIIINVKNDSGTTIDKSIAFRIARHDNNDESFYYEGFEPFVNLLNINDPVEYIQPTLFDMGVYSAPFASNSTKSFIHWMHPNGKPTGAVNVVLNYSDTTPQVVSANTLSPRGPLEIGKAYHVYAVWDGEKLEITDDDYIVPEDPTDLPYITLTTTK